MTPKQRVIAAINHQRPDRIPLDGNFREDVWAKLEGYFGTVDPEEIMENLGLDIRYPQMEPSAAFAEQAIPSPWPIPDIGAGKRNLGIVRDDGSFEDEYGVRRVPNSTGLYWLYSYHPLAGAGLEEVKRYPFPDPRLEERYSSLRSDLARWKNKYFTVIEIRNIFKLSWELRGFERFMMDLSLDPRLVETLADRALEHLVEISKQLARCGVDMLMITGDIAMQERMMLSPGMWRRYFKPRLRLWLEEVRREQNPYFMFHSDGNMADVMGDLVKIGFDAITPIQPECMEVNEIKRRFGSQVCLHGTISCQRTLPFGTPRDVADEVRQRIYGCGKDGGLILSPSNTVQPDVPLENVLALYQTAQSLSLQPDEKSD
jgi:uroporphyrinogen decarboxylase